MTKNQINEEEKTTTISLSIDTKKKLDAVKVHPRETYDDILNRLVNIVDN